MDFQRTVSVPRQVLRQLDRNDVQAYARLLTGLKPRDRLERFLTQMNDQELQGYSMRLLMDKYPVIGAFENGDLIGAIDIGTDESGVAALGIVVAEDSRQRGFGSKLMDAAVELCAQRGVDDAYFDCFITNRAMVNLANATGFRQLCHGRPATYHRSIPGDPAEIVPPVGGAIIIDFLAHRKQSA